ncbi:MAG: cohesin domain-containing protein [archaeon]
MVLWLGCESIDNPGADNPLDPDNPGFIEPAVTIVSGPEYDETVKTHTVTFILRLNETASEFTYKLNDGLWSAWQADTTVTLTYLDEGIQEFHFKARNAAGIEQETTDSTYFIVDAVTGPALMFVPRKVIVQQNENFSVEIWAEEVSNLAGTTVEIPINNSEIEFVSADIYESSESFLGKDAGVLVVNEGSPGESLFRATQYRVGQPATVSGSGSLMRLTFRFKGAQSTQLAFSSNCAMLDSAMQAIPIQELVGLEIIRE